MSRLLRQRLTKEFPTDQDFDAFCLDHYPHVKKRFTQTMDRVAKINLLIEIINNEAEIVRHLDEYSNLAISDASITRKKIPQARSRKRTKAIKKTLADALDPLQQSAPNSRYQPVSHTSIILYKWCWQLVNWFRLIVYVELRASRIDWEAPLVTATDSLPPGTFAEDKRLSHMATSHRTSISYLTLNDLWSIIEDEKNWPLFEYYIFPYKTAKIRMDEIKLIVDRIINFREPHPQDKARLEPFMRDIEPGLRQFCHRYTCPKIPSERDELTDYLHSIWSNLHFGIELQCADHSWLYASGRYRFNPAMNASIDLLTHRLYKSHSPEGVIYALTFRPTVGSELDALSALKQTRLLRGDIIHIFMFNYMTVTIPAILGTEQVGDSICKLLDIARSCSHSNQAGRILNLSEDVKREWPEYVLWENHMLDLFSPDMKELTIDLS